jgi:hypothetical protein
MNVIKDGDLAEAEEQVAIANLKASNSEAELIRLTLAARREDEKCIKLSKVRYKLYRRVTQLKHIKDGKCACLVSDRDAFRPSSSPCPNKAKNIFCGIHQRVADKEASLRNAQLG